ncbi:S1-like RNA-binding domain conataining protein [Candidatus Hepatincola sp. Av]
MKSSSCYPLLQDGFFIVRLVPIRSVSNSYVMFDAINHTIKNRAKKKLYKLGDKVQVILSATDEIRGLITFSLAKSHF